MTKTFVTMVLLSASAASAADGGARAPLRLVLLEDATPRAHCGGFEMWTVLRFQEQPKPTQWLIAVPCTELTRPQYGAAAGTAGLLVKGKTYLVTVSEKAATGPWGAQVAYRAERIDEAR